MLLEFGILVMFLAFICEYFDSTLGMGYGTILVPLLIVFGLEPLQIVPAILLSELVTGFLAAGAHHCIGNVDFRDKKVFGIVTTLALCSVVGTVLAVFIAISIPPFYVKLYIALLVFSMGILILWRRKITEKFSWAKITLLGFVAAFNKGMSGGGYGPLIVSGQILSGVDEKKAVCITSLAEGIVCLVGLAAYILFAGSIIDWELSGFLLAGAVLSIPFTALSVKRLSSGKLRVLVGFAILLLSIFIFWRLIA